jgi:hypothetical protein
MRTTLSTGLASAATLLALAGCGQGATGQPYESAVAPFGAPVVSLGASGTSRTRVVGGTAAMRARARAILAGMGDVAIAEVRFGRPPTAFARFRREDGPIWLSTTVVAHGSPFGGPLRSQFDADGPLWQATVFANAYEASQPVGGPRLRGSSEALSVAGRAHPFSSESGPADPYGGTAETDSEIRRTVAQAAARARFRVVSISIVHPNRQAATVVVRALRRAAFARRYDEFVRGLGSLAARLDGLQWQVVDRCGYPVAVQSVGGWTSPRWLCPNPYIPGLAMTRATCRKLPRGFPPCASTG